MTYSLPPSQLMPPAQVSLYTPPGDPPALDLDTDPEPATAIVAATSVGSYSIPPPNLRFKYPELSLGNAVEVSRPPHGLFDRWS